MATKWNFGEVILQALQHEEDQRNQRSYQDRTLALQQRGQDVTEQWHKEATLTEAKRYADQLQWQKDQNPIKPLRDFLPQPFHKYFSAKQLDEPVPQAEADHMTQRIASFSQAESADATRRYVAEIAKQSADARTAAAAQLKTKDRLEKQDNEAQSVYAAAMANLQTPDLVQPQAGLSRTLGPTLGKLLFGDSGTQTTKPPRKPLPEKVFSSDTSGNIFSGRGPLNTAAPRISLPDGLDLRKGQDNFALAMQNNSMTASAQTTNQIPALPTPSRGLLGSVWGALVADPARAAFSESNDPGALNANLRNNTGRLQALIALQKHYSKGLKDGTYSSTDTYRAIQGQLASMLTQEYGGFQSGPGATYAPDSLLMNAVKNSATEAQVLSGFRSPSQVRQQNTTSNILTNRVLGEASRNGGIDENSIQNLKQLLEMINK